MRIQKKFKAFNLLLLLFVAAETIMYSCNNNVSKNTINQDKITLGRYLFYDRRLSINNTKSCGTCHNPAFAFTDGYKRSLGAFADLHQRNTEPLFNLAQQKYFTAADSSIHSVFQQMNNPLFKTNPIEMGVNGAEDIILERLKKEKIYKNLFSKIGEQITWQNIKSAIASFELNLISNNSPYDKFIKGDKLALSESAKKGMELFNSINLKCSSCHGGNNFSSPILINEKKDTSFYFNTGLYNTDGKGSYPNYDQGLYQFTSTLNDMGKFRVPTLRNLAFTAPYYHDGSGASLTDVIENYARGGRLIKEGIYKGDGKTNTYKHAFINGFELNATNKLDLINFLLSLSDSSFVNNTNYQNPFTEDETKY
jgi:cytochrome c peroxidase